MAAGAGMKTWRYMLKGVFGANYVSRPKSNKCIFAMKHGLQRRKQRKQEL